MLMLIDHMTENIPKAGQSSHDKCTARLLQKTRLKFRSNRRLIPAVLSKQISESPKGVSTCPAVPKTSRLCLLPPVTELQHWHDGMPSQKEAYNKKKVQGTCTNCMDIHFIPEPEDTSLLLPLVSGTMKNTVREINPCQPHSPVIVLEELAIQPTQMKSAESNSGPKNYNIGRY